MRRALPAEDTANSSDSVEAGMGGMAAGITLDGVRFTLSGSDTLEMALQNMAAAVASEIVTEVNPRAIFLTGSAGRSEMTAYEDGRGIHVISDLEVGVVSRALWKGWRLRHLQRRLAEEHRVDLTLMLFLPRRFTSAARRNLSLRRSYLSIMQYETLSSARFIYGPNLAEAVDAMPAASQISPVEGIRLILNRMIELVACLLDRTDRMHQFKWALKLLIASGDAALLGTGQYHFSYRTRMRCHEQDPTILARVGLMPPGRATIIAAYFSKLTGARPGAVEMESFLKECLSIGRIVFEKYGKRVYGVPTFTPQFFRQRCLGAEGSRRIPALLKHGLPNAMEMVRLTARGHRLPWHTFLTPHSIVDAVFVEFYEWFVTCFWPGFRECGYQCLQEVSLRAAGRAIVEKWKVLCL